jgi:hypothetical protein
LDIAQKRLCRMQTSAKSYRDQQGNISDMNHDIEQIYEFAAKALSAFQHADDD